MKFEKGDIEQASRDVIEEFLGKLFLSPKGQFFLEMIKKYDFSALLPYIEKDPDMQKADREGTSFGELLADEKRYTAILDRAYQAYCADNPAKYEDRTQVKTFTKPTDKVADVFGTLKQQDIEKGGIIVEENIKKGRKKETVQTRMLFNVPYTDKGLVSPPDVFDISVLWACSALREGGRNFVTANTIYQVMTGKGLGRSKKISEQLKADIIASVKKMMTFPVVVQAGEVCSMYGFTGKLKAGGQMGVALPAVIRGEGTLNGGQVEEVIELKYESAFMELARIKNKQITTYDTALLDVPKLNANRQTVPIPHYLLTRIEASKHGKHMQKKILIDTAIEATQYTGKRERFLEVVKKCFDFWTEKNYLCAYEFEKEGRKTVAVKFTLPPKKITEV